jgi:hypothetical protein
MGYDPTLAERIRRALGRRRDVVEKRMFGGIAFMVRGHMALGIVGTTLMVRVEPAAEAALLRRAHARPMDFTGRPLRGFLFVDAPGFATAATLRAWVGHAVARAEAQPARDERGLSVRVTRPARAAKAKTRAKAPARAKVPPRAKATPRAKTAPRAKAAPKRARARRVTTRTTRRTR